MGQVAMAYSVPGTSDGVDAGKTGAMEGGAVAIGEVLGRSLLGPGIGTAAGGIAIAAANSGNSRDRMAAMAIERAVNEVFGN